MEKRPKHLLLQDYKHYLAKFDCILSGKMGVELHPTVFRSCGHTLDNSLIPISPEIHYLIHHGKCSALSQVEFKRYSNIVKMDLRILAVELFTTWCREDSLLRGFDTLFLQELEIFPEKLEEITIKYMKERWLETD
jgi:hypothetical protein